MIEDPEIVNARLYLRWYRIRQVRKDLVPALIQEGPYVWTFDDTNPIDPWGSRVRLPLEELERMVSAAELELRKSAASASRADRREERCA